MYIKHGFELEKLNKQKEISQLMQRNSNKIIFYIKILLFPTCDVKPTLNWEPAVGGRFKDFCAGFPTTLYTCFYMYVHMLFHCAAKQYRIRTQTIEGISTTKCERNLCHDL